MSIRETVEPEITTSYKCFSVIYDADGNAPSSDTLIATSTEELANAASAIMQALKAGNTVQFEGKFYEGGPSPYVEGYEWACSFQVLPSICSYVPARNIAEVLEQFEQTEKQYVEGDIVDLDSLT